MPVATLRQLLESGVHFGHQTSRWNPRMKPYIFTARNGIHIIDLQQTQRMLDEACAFARDLVAGGQKVLFVGTKKQAKDSIIEATAISGQYYVVHRWMGGMLTNFPIIQRRLKVLQELRASKERGDFDRMGNKEANVNIDELERLERNFSGMVDMKRLPGALFIVDCKKERLAVMEANKLRIPIIAIADSNVDPESLQYVIPGNDDAIRSVKLIVTLINDAILEGQRLLSEREMREHREQEVAQARADEEAAAKAAAEQTNTEDGDGTATVAEAEFTTAGAGAGSGNQDKEA